MKHSPLVAGHVPVVTMATRGTPTTMLNTMGVHAMGYAARGSGSTMVRALMVVILLIRPSSTFKNLGDSSPLTNFVGPLCG